MKDPQGSRRRRQGAMPGKTSHSSRSASDWVNPVTGGAKKVVVPAGCFTYMGGVRIRTRQPFNPSLGRQ